MSIIQHVTKNDKTIRNLSFKNMLLIEIKETVSFVLIDKCVVN